MATATPKPDKKVLKAALAKVRADINMAKSVLAEYETAANGPIGELVTAYGPGPHKFTEGDRVVALTFRKHGDGFKTTEQDLTAMIAAED